MKIRELIGDEIMDAYNGDYLASDFGYSCANFNVEKNWWGMMNWKSFESFENVNDENPPHSFDFYTKNIKNVSCFVCYNKYGKIWGRRMFFKGPSLVNDEEFDVPVKMGSPIHYLYGYYGANDPEPQLSILQSVIKKYGKNILYTNRAVLQKGLPNYKLTNLWIMGLDKTDFIKYPPVDLLYVSTELNAIANFDPKKYIIEILESDHKKSGVKFHPAYRFKPGQKDVKYHYKTWDHHKGTITSSSDYTNIISQEEDEEGEKDYERCEEIDIKNLKKGDKIKSKFNHYYLIKEIGASNVVIQTIDKNHEWVIPIFNLKEMYYKVN
jgi:hypothetical protein